MLEPNAIIETLQVTYDTLWPLLVNKWSLYQIGIIIVLYVISWLISRKVEPPLEDWVRQIKGNPGLLRVCAAALRRTEWMIFIPLLWASLQGLLLYTWPSRTFVLQASLKLAIAWFLISVLSRIIRNRSLSKLVRFGGWIVAALSIVGFLDDVSGLLDRLAFSIGNLRLSVLTIIKGVVLIAGLMWLATTVGNYAENRIKTSQDLTPSLKVLLGKVVKFGLIVAALGIALSSIGIDLTALTVFSGAVGVGIGFGLQKVVSNFISGIIILLDKSIKPGDTISLGDTFGWIRELRARFVSVVTRDGREFLIPNEDLITQQVVNWSFTDDLIRLDVPFGVSYEANPHKVSELAIAACKTLERVNVRKEPVCWMTGFGDSSLDFVLRFWVNDPQNGLTNIRGKTLLALWDTFDEHGINIPFPHREIIMRTPVEVADKVPSDKKRNAQAKDKGITKAKTKADQTTSSTKTGSKG